VNFAKGSGCISCHSNSLTAMTVGAAKKQGFHIDEKVEAEQVKVNVENLENSRDDLHEGFLVPAVDYFSEGIVGYMLMGLAAEGYKADLNTDAVAMYLVGRQQLDGSWPEPPVDTRQPLCEQYIGQTVQAMRGLQLYAPKLNAAAYKQAIARAAAWLATAKSSNNDDRSWRLIGLAWAGTNPAAKAKAIRELLAAQKPDGGWSDIPSMESTAYATGKSLVALRTAGMAVENPAYKRGVKWLLEHQDVDGSWYVQTRALAFQPDFDPGFPHGHDQFISQAGTNWAAMALTISLPEKKSVGVKTSAGNR
jgi:Squalene-hopene cyclase C-terminal domain/Prenyltransferase and squalene oxidase repeat